MAQHGANVLNFALAIFGMIALFMPHSGRMLWSFYRPIIETLNILRIERLNILMDSVSVFDANLHLVFVQQRIQSWQSFCS